MTGSPRYYLTESLNVASGRITYEVRDEQEPGRIVARARVWRQARFLVDGLNADVAAEQPGEVSP